MKGNELAIVEVVGDVNNHLIPLGDDNGRRREVTVDADDRTLNSIRSGSYIRHFPIENRRPGIHHRPQRNDQTEKPTLPEGHGGRRCGGVRRGQSGFWPTFYVTEIWVSKWSGIDPKGRSDPRVSGRRQSLFLKLIQLACPNYA